MSNKCELVESVSKYVPVVCVDLAWKVWFQILSKVDIPDNDWCRYWIVFVHGCIGRNYIHTFNFWLEPQHILRYQTAISARKNIPLQRVETELYDNLFREAYLLERLSFVNLIITKDPTIMTRNLTYLETLFREGLDKRLTISSQWLEPILRSIYGDVDKIKWIFIYNAITRRKNKTIKWFLTLWPDVPLDMYNNAIINTYFQTYFSGNYSYFDKRDRIIMTIIRWYQSHYKMIIFDHTTNTFSARPNYKKISDHLDHGTCSIQITSKLGLITIRNDNTTDQCAVCDESSNHLISLPCKHVFCLRDLVQWRINNPRPSLSCFLCRQPWSWNKCTSLVLVSTSDNETVSLLNN